MEGLAIKQEFKLTDKQDEAISLLSGLAMFILLYGGSRSTKTFTFIWAIVWRALAVGFRAAYSRIVRALLQYQKRCLTKAVALP